MRTRKATAAEIAKYNAFVNPRMEKLKALAVASNFKGWSDEQNALSWQIDCFEKQSGIRCTRNGIRKVIG